MGTLPFTSTSPASVLHVVRGADYSNLSQPPKLFVTNLIPQMRKTEAQRKLLLVVCLKKLSEIFKEAILNLWVHSPFGGL